MHTNTFAVTIQDSRPEMPEVDAEWIKRVLIESQGKFPTGVTVEHLGSDIDSAAEGKCWRCGVHVESRIELIWLDGELRNDCPESGDGAPHEITAPEGWDD